MSLAPGAKTHSAMTDTALPFPSVRTRGVVALIDDDSGFVHTLTDLLACYDFSVAAFTHPAALHEFMTTRLHSLSLQRSQIDAIRRAQAEGNVAIEALRFFATPTRFDMPLALISDYSMPSETGLSICSKYSDAGIRRVLLTGVADMSVAVFAFNSGFIEQYIQKQGERFPMTIVEALREQLTISALRRGAPLAEELSAELASTLANPTAAAALWKLLEKLQVREYMMIGEPQGMLAITATGKAIWIQLETESSVGDLIEHILDLACVDSAALERIRQRKSLMATEWMQQIDREPEEQDAQVLSVAPVLLAAAYTLQLPSELRPAVPAKGD